MTQMTISYIVVFIFAVCCSSSCKSCEWFWFLRFLRYSMCSTVWFFECCVWLLCCYCCCCLLLLEYLTKMCVDFQIIMKIWSDLLSVMQINFRTVFVAMDLFWLLNNNTRHFCEYNHDKKKFRHKWKSVLNRFI